MSCPSARRAQPWPLARSPSSAQKKGKDVQGAVEKRASVDLGAAEVAGEKVDEQLGSERVRAGLAERKARDESQEPRLGAGQRAGKRRLWWQARLEDACNSERVAHLRPQHAQHRP